MCHWRQFVYWCQFYITRIVLKKQKSNKNGKMSQLKKNRIPKITTKISAANPIIITNKRKIIPINRENVLKMKFPKNLAGSNPPSR